MRKLKNLLMGTLLLSVICGALLLSSCMPYKSTMTKTTPVLDNYIDVLKGKKLTDKQKTAYLLEAKNTKMAIKEALKDPGWFISSPFAESDTADSPITTVIAEVTEVVSDKPIVLAENELPVIRPKCSPPATMNNYLFPRKTPRCSPPATRAGITAQFKESTQSASGSGSIQIDKLISQINCLRSDHKRLGEALATINSISDIN